MEEPLVDREEKFEPDIERYRTRNSEKLKLEQNEHYRSNQYVLVVTCATFALFVAAEIAGALVSIIPCYFFLKLLLYYSNEYFNPLNRRVIHCPFLVMPPP